MDHSLLPTRRDDSEGYNNSFNRIFQILNVCHGEIIQQRMVQHYINMSQGKKYFSKNNIMRH